MLYQDTKVEGISQAELKQAWGEWLTELGDKAGGWDWWATLTFRDPHNPRLPNWTKPGWSYTEKAYNALVLHLTFLNDLKPVKWVRGKEYQHWRGVPHFHSLISGVANLRRDEVWGWWFEKYGLARIEPYDRSLGAGFYLCKYVTKELGDIQFSKHLTTS